MGVKVDVVDAYLEAALALQGLELPHDAVERVSAQFRRIAGLAGSLSAFPVEPGDGAAPVFTLDGHDR